MGEERKASVSEIVRNGIIYAGSTFRGDKIKAYKRAIKAETNPNARWVMETILENAMIAERDKSPLCDDTGIAHLILDLGEGACIDAELLDQIKFGVKEGLKLLPGRPMAICGSDIERIDQSGGLSDDPGDVEPAPILIRRMKEQGVRLHILMFGGGPAIRAKTYRVFHKHNIENVLEEIVNWSVEGVKQLGCSPCTLGVGIGRSHFEATSMMLQALADGTYDVQNEMEKEITRRVNSFDIGALGLHGAASVLGTFLKVGPQRASGVRIVCVRPCCCFEPRVASVIL